MDDDAKAFYLEEYKALRKEAELYISEIRSQERYVVVSISAIWYWLIHEHKSHWLLWFVPILICVASGLRMFGIERHFRNLSSHIKRLEKLFGVNGWEQATRAWSLGTVNIILLSFIFVLSVLAWCLRKSLSA